MYRTFLTNVKKLIVLTMLICLIFSQTGVSAKTIKYTTVNKSNAEEARCWYILNKLVRRHKKDVFSN